MTTDRLIAFDRVLNFRDFGGYDTPNGPIARGKLFRSASFHDATDTDMSKLDGLGVRFLVDLRRPEERSFEANKWPGDAVQTIFHEEGVGAGLPPHLVALIQSDLTPDSVTTYMTDLYREFPFDTRLIALYRRWFEELAQGGAGIIHCAAGKDRTGFGCALTHLALGVDEDAVFADYDFTNQAVDIEARLPRIQARFEERLGRKLSAAALRPMLGVSSDYLRASFDAIATKHGDMNAYLADVLNVGEAERARLRETLIA